jgi:hypothetical protein
MTILFYGCWTSESGQSEVGHFFRTRQGESRVRWRRHDGVLSDSIDELVPWGFRVDGQFAPRVFLGAEAPNGCAGFHQAISWVGCPSEVAWSLISWWDNSVDTRGGSSCSFMVDRRATPAEILAEARVAFPQVFARFNYEVVLPGLP